MKIPRFHRELEKWPKSKKQLWWRTFNKTSYEGTEYSIKDHIFLQCSYSSSYTKGNPENIYFCFTDKLKAFDCADHNKLWKNFKEMEILNRLTCLQRNLNGGQEPTVRNGQGTTFKLGKGYIKAIYCHSAYLTYMQSTSCEMLGWMNHKLESRSLGEIPTNSDRQLMWPPLWLKEKRN